MTDLTRLLSRTWYNTILIALLAFFFASSLCGQQDVSEKGVLVIGGDSYYPPYEFLNENGEPSGFGVELIKAIGLEMGLKIEVQLNEWHQTYKDLIDNKIDAVIGMAYSIERAESFSFSRPHSQFDSIIVVRKENNSIKQESDLKNKKVVVQYNDIFHEYLLSKDYNNEILTTNTPDSTLILLSEGYAEAALINSNQFEYLDTKHKYTNLKVVPGYILANEFCFGTTKEKRYIVAMLNEGLTRVKENGTYSYLQNKWLGTHYEKSIYPQIIAQYAFIIIIAISCLAFIIIIWILSLKKQVKKKTIELKEELDKHKVTAEVQQRGQNVLEAMYNISEAVTTSKSLFEFYCIIHKNVKNLMVADDFYIALYNEDSKYLSFPYFNDRTSASLPEPRREGRGLTEYAIRRGKPLLLNYDKIKELNEQNEIELIGASSQQWLGAPLKLGDIAIGLVAVQNYVDPNAYDENDKQTLTFISEQIAHAIERIQHQESIKRTIIELEDKVVERTSELKKSEQAYRTLTENSPDLIMRLDPLLRIIYVNPTIVKYTNIQVDDLIGKKLEDLLLPKDIETIISRNINTAFDKGVVTSIELNLPDGTWLDSNIVPELSHDGRVTSVIVSAHDITIRKAFQRELNELNVQLEERVKERTMQLEDEIAANVHYSNIQRALFLISDSVHTAKDIQDLYEFIYRIIKQFMVVNNFSIALYDEEKQLITFPFNENEFDEHPEPRKLMKGITEYALAKDEPLLVREKELQRLIEKEEVVFIGRPTKSWLGIPLKVDNKIIGLLIVKDYENDEAFSDNDIQILTFASEQIALAIERKESEQHKNRQNMFFQQLFNNTPVGIAILDNEDRIIDVNQGFTTIFEYVREEIIGKKINPLVTPENLSSEANSVSKITQAGDVMEVETYRQTKRGEIKRVKLFGVPIKVDNVQVGIYGIYLDITPLQNIQDSLAQEKEKFSVMLSSIGDGVIATSLDGKIVLLNKVAQELTGWTQEEAEGAEVQQVFNIADAKEQNMGSMIVQNVAEGNKTLRLSNKTTLTAKDGTEYLIEDSAAPIRDVNGTVNGVIIVFRDITQKILIEEELQKSAKLESVGLLAGGIAHDFNNILTGIMGNISFAKTFADSGNKRLLERLNEAERASLKAKELALQLLTYAKGGDPVKTTTSIRELLENTAKYSITQPNINYHFDITKDLNNVEIDTGQISQALNNLLQNSQQAMAKGGNIYVSAKNITATEPLYPSFKPGDYIEITIRDTGSGISNNELNKIFDPFYTTKKEGSGLGLTTSYSIIRKHDGYVFAESELGKGTTIAIYLPASTKYVADPIPENTEIEGNGSILLMDDDLILVEVVTEMLSSLGYDVVATHDGVEAFDKYQEMKELGQKFDLVILDLTIPGGVGGKDTVKKILEYDPDAVCIVSSGYSSDPVMADYQNYGFKAVLGKPYSFNQLGSVVKSVLNKSTASAKK